MRKKKSVKFAPVFRPLEIVVIGVDKNKYHHRMMIVPPGVEYDSMGWCVIYIHKD